jgi:hypothetical protein
MYSIKLKGDKFNPANLHDKNVERHHKPRIVGSFWRQALASLHAKKGSATINRG